MCNCYMMSSGEHLGFQMDDGAAARYCEEAGVLLRTIKDFSRNFPRRAVNVLACLGSIKVKIKLSRFEKLRPMCFRHL